MADPVCTKCGAALLPTGVCSACGHNAHIDLEIAAFMTPHINRARIVLVLMGALYLYFGYRAYDGIAALRDAVDAWAAKSHDGSVDELKSAVTIAYVSVVVAMVTGAANIVLAAIAGTKTMLAFNIAAGLFVIHTCLQAYVSSGTVFMSLLWWITAICLAMGYQAARKAETLRRGG
jgi:hypothetical protein